MQQHPKTAQKLALPETQAKLGIIHNFATPQSAYETTKTFNEVYKHKLNAGKTRRLQSLSYNY